MIILKAFQCLWSFAFLSQQNSEAFFYVIGTLSAGFHAASVSF